MTISSPFPDGRQRGFTLVELAVVLVIIALLSGGLMMTLTAQMDSVAISETRHRLNDARDALLGYAAAYGRLPCPAAPGATGVERPAGGGPCDNSWDGLLPAITLGLNPTDENGYALDGWGNPIRYAVTRYANNTHCASPNLCFATSNGIKAIWNGDSTPAPDLKVCNTATGIVGASCAAGATLTDDAVAIILSRGRNGGLAPSSADELANDGSDRVFVSHLPTAAGANEFDDLVIWLSPNILYNRMIAAGRLP